MASGTKSPRIVSLLAACVLALAAAGCARKNAQAKVPVSAAPSSAEAERPMNAAPDTTAEPPVEAVIPPPALAPAVAPPPPVPIPSKKPAGPRKPVAEQPVTEGAHGAASAFAPAADFSPDFSGRPGKLRTPHQRRHCRGRKEPLGCRWHSAERLPAGPGGQNSQLPRGVAPGQQGWRLGTRADTGAEGAAALRGTDQFTLSSSF